MSNTDTNPNQKLAVAVKNVHREIVEEAEREEIGIPGFSRLDVLYGNIVNILLDDFELEISYKTAESRVHDTFEAMMAENMAEGYGDPVSRFRREWPEIAGGSSRSEFTIVAPLPIQDRKGVLPSEITFNGHTLKHIGSKQWSEFKERATTTEAEDNAEYPSDLDIFIQGTDVQKPNTSEYSFWRFDIRGIDADHVVQQINSVLNVFLGQLSYVADNRQPIIVDGSLNQIRTNTRTVFQLPPFYLIFRDSDLYRIHPQTYPVRKPIPRIKSNFQFERMMDSIPSLETYEEVTESIYKENESVHVRSIEATLAAAFKTFGRGMRETDPESMFLWLYRSLEHITFTKYANSRESLDRSLRLLAVDSDSQLNQFIEFVTDRRNAIVHDGTDSQITQTELNLVKSLSVSTIKHVGKIAQTKETDEIITRLVTSDIGPKIRNLEQEKETKRERVEDITEELRVLHNANNWDH